jgi:short-subunit dehydrogenase
MKLNKKEINRLKSRYGDWILITGATSGMGAELALKFGEAGFNLALAGRRQERLVSFASEMSEKYGVETFSVTGDLSTELDVSLLMDKLRHLPISIAVMNAGFGTSGKFIDSDIHEEINMLDLNCKALMVLTHHFGNRFAKAGKGAIVLMSSMVAFQGVPNAAHYAATKAYVQTLGEAIAIELKPRGVDVLMAAPGPVESGFAKRAGMSMSRTLKPEQVGVPIIRSIGRRTTALPGFLTKLLVYNLRMVPRWAKVRIMGNVMAGFTRHHNL